MNYIVNPIWFYLIDVLRGIEIFFIAIAVICITVIFICLLAVVFNYGLVECSILSKKTKQMLKIFMPILFISLLFIVIIPSTETMYTILVSKFATYENANNAISAIKDATDYIVNAIATIKGK